MSEAFKIEDIFAENVFTVAKMKERLPKKVFANLKNVMDNGGQLAIEDADVIAKAMKDWAQEKGATHYTHWFQPLITSLTAEKHDSFVTHPDEDGKVISSLQESSSLWESLTLLLSHQADFVQHVRQEVTQYGMLLLLHLSGKVQ